MIKFLSWNLLWPKVSRQMWQILYHFSDGRSCWRHWGFLVNFKWGAFIFGECPGPCPPSRGRWVTDVFLYPPSQSMEVADMCPEDCFTLAHGRVHPALPRRPEMGTFFPSLGKPDRAARLGDPEWALGNVKLGWCPSRVYATNNWVDSDKPWEHCN